MFADDINFSSSRRNLTTLYENINKQFRNFTKTYKLLKINQLSLNIKTNFIIFLNKINK